MPLEQQGRPLLWIAGFTDGGNVKTGLTVTVNVWEFIIGGAKTKIVNADNATEAGDGLYYYELAAGSVDENAIYVAVFFTAGTVDQQDIFADWVVGPTWIENLDAASSTLATAAALATAQADLDNPAQYKADVSALALEANVQGYVTAALGAYDPPTKTEMDNAFAALNDISVADMLAGVIEGTLDLQEVLRIILSFVAGRTSGGNTTNPQFMSQDGLTTRIDMTVDDDGDRSSVTVDGS